MNRPSNQSRARRGERHLVLYAFGCERSADLTAGRTAATLVTDFITDLLHIAHVLGIDTGSCLDMSRMHYEAEIAEEGGAT